MTFNFCELLSYNKPYQKSRVWMIISYFLLDEIVGVLEGLYEFRHGLLVRFLIREDASVLADNDPPVDSKWRSPLANYKSCAWAKGAFSMNTKEAFAPMQPTTFSTRYQQTSTTRWWFHSPKTSIPPPKKVVCFWVDLVFFFLRRSFPEYLPVHHWLAKRLGGRSLVLPASVVPFQLIQPIGKIPMVVLKRNTGNHWNKVFLEFLDVSLVC